MAQPEEGIWFSKSQNSHSVFFALTLTFYSGASKICILGFCLCFQFIFKYYLVICYILLIFCALLASSLLCPFWFFHCVFLLRGRMSCWFVFKTYGQIFALSGDLYMKWMTCVCSRCKLLPPSVHKAVYKLSYVCLTFKRGEKRAFFLVSKQWYWQI